MRNTISVETTVNAPIETIWPAWNDPTHVTKWNSASPDWHTPYGENNLRVGGSFKFRMEARDGSQGFDFEGVYDEIVPGRHIAYTMTDGRKVQINFSADAETGGVTVAESFESDDEFPVDVQRAGWQAILDSFKGYVEGLRGPESPTPGESEVV